MIDRVFESEVMDDAAEAAEYAAADFSVANGAFVDRLLGLGAGRRMIDLGTGPGDIPILIADRFAGLDVEQESGAVGAGYRKLHITGVDLSPVMLGIARERVEAAGHRGCISLLEADVKGLMFPDGMFDVVFSNTILHHIPEPVEMLAEARRLLKPGGVLLIRDLIRPGSEAELEGLVEKHAAGDNERQRRLFADSLRAALMAEELREMVAGMGWDGAEVVVDTDRHMSLQVAAVD